jgi:hypothetical protein
MILFLDDSPVRTKRLLYTIPSAICTSTAAGMIALLEKHGSENPLVMLDHDLDGQTFVDSNEENTGMGVVRWIVSNRPNIRAIIVHSLNRSAAHNMAIKLSEAGYNVSVRPFIKLDFDALSEGKYVP